MDPSATLRNAQDLLDSGEYLAARSALQDYWEWRRRGGYEPPLGDATAKVIGHAADFAEV